MSPRQCGRRISGIAVLGPEPLSAKRCDWCQLAATQQLCVGLVAWQAGEIIGMDALEVSSDAMGVFGTEAKVDLALCIRTHRSLELGRQLVEILMSQCPTDTETSTLGQYVGEGRWQSQVVLELVGVDE